MFQTLQQGPTNIACATNVYASTNNKHRQKEMVETMQKANDEMRDFSEKMEK